MNDTVTRACAQPGCWQPGAHGLVVGGLIEWFCADHWPAAVLRLLDHFRPSRTALRAAA